MELSLVKTLAKKFKTSCQKIYKRYRTTIDTKDGIYKVLLVKVEREEKLPLITYFGGVSLWGATCNRTLYPISYALNLPESILDKFAPSAQARAVSLETAHM
ncbi:hypothetical protein NIES4106_58600 (plasmid) [Fischerella sp. NIES-4106]|nr:hypothetical protein NIES4106_58600 [Fischerella sp. NIES-4106]